MTVEEEFTHLFTVNKAQVNACFNKNVVFFYNENYEKNNAKLNKVLKDMISKFQDV